MSCEQKEVDASVEQAPTKAKAECCPASAPSEAKTLPTTVEIDVKPGLDHAIYAHFMTLGQGNTVQAEYVWLGGQNEVRSKTKTLTNRTEVKDLSELPIWNYDGSSTGQAPTENSEVLLRPVKVVPDPFRRGNNVLVLCETLNDKEEPLLPFNTRVEAKRLFDMDTKAEPWFGIEQEYTLFQADGKTPLGFPKDGLPNEQGQYYCSAGTGNAYGRMVADCHYRACLYAGLDISGINAEVMPGQWEYQVGPSTGIDSGDQMWLSRYIMERICEKFGVMVNWHPKPKDGDWNGAGCHTNFSTEPMRTQVEGFPKPYDYIVECVKRLGERHQDHIAIYGIGNDKRLTGKHETCGIDTFRYGVADRGSSIRIPRETFLKQKGYFEDRRPASNMDPYVVTSRVFATSTGIKWTN